MIPVDQTRFGLNASDAPPGNCWAACIASILELPLIEVPDEAATWKLGMNNRTSWLVYEPIVHEWLRSIGWILLAVDTASLDRGDFDAICIAVGDSPRNQDFQHAVVYRGDETLLHDPHPERRGIMTVNTLEVFVRMNPAGF